MQIKIYNIRVIIFINYIIAMEKSLWLFTRFGMWVNNLFFKKESAPHLKEVWLCNPFDSKKRDVIICNLRKRGASYKEIMSFCNISKNTVYNVLKKNKLTGSRGK